MINMTMSNKKGVRRRLEDFIASDRGQRFFNFAYSIGAAVVIWGALFKILHLPGGDTLLTIGMGTEVIMFFLTAFDRPPVQNESIIATPPATATEPVVLPECDGMAGEVKGVMTEMNKLRETTAALNTLYELQIKSVSVQLGTMENGNRDTAIMHEMMSKSAEQSRRYYEEASKMADNMAQLNSIYERMINAMTAPGNTDTGINK